MPLPKRRIEALDQRDDVAVLVDHGQVDRVAARGVGQRRRTSTGSTLHAAFAGSISFARAASRASLLSIGSTGTFVELRVGDVAQHVGVGELLRFDHHVQRLGAVEPVLARADTAPSCSASSARRCPACSAAARTPSSRDRSSRSGRPTPAGTPSGRRRSSSRPSRARPRGSPRRSCLRRSRPASLRRDQPQRRGEVGVLEHFAGRAAAGRRAGTSSPRSGSAASFADQPAHASAITSVTGNPFVGVEDRRRQQVRHRQRAEPRRAARPSPPPRPGRSRCRCRCPASA